MPAEILTRLNKDLIDAGIDKHITMFVGFLNRKDNTLTYSIAAHHPLPVIYKDGKASFIELKNSSFPVGLLPEAEYFEEKIPFEKASLTLCSDGILEVLPSKAWQIKKKESLK